MRNLIPASNEQQIVSLMRNEWHSPIKRTSELSLYPGRSFPEAIKKHPYFVVSLLYVTHIFHGIEQLDFSEHVSSETQQECLRLEREGKMCVYLSTLLYGLLLEQGVCHDRQLKYVQGYFWHKARTDTFIGELFGNVHMSNHAWLLVEQAVLDVSIRQEKYFFDLDNHPILIGEVPPGLYLKGFVEPKKTVTTHLTSYAAAQNGSYSEWISRHISQAKAYFTTYREGS